MRNDDELSDREWYRWANLQKFPSSEGADWQQSWMTDRGKLPKKPPSGSGAKK